MTRAGLVGPLSLLAACLLPVAGAFAVTTPPIGLITLAADVLAFGWLVLDPLATMLRVAVGLVAAATLASSTWLYAGHDLDRSAAAALRILCIVVPAAMLSPLIRPSELGDHLAQRLRLPARPVAGAVAPDPAGAARSGDRCRRGPAPAVAQPGRERVRAARVRDASHGTARTGDGFPRLRDCP